MNKHLSEEGLIERLQALVAEKEQAFDKRPTIAELEAILAADESSPIEIQPNGEVRAAGARAAEIATLKDAIAALQPPPEGDERVKVLEEAAKVAESFLYRRPSFEEVRAVPLSTPLPTMLSDEEADAVNEPLERIAAAIRALAHQEPRL